MVTDSMTIIDYVAVIGVFLLSFVLIREILNDAPFSFSITKNVIAFCMAVIIVLGFKSAIINVGIFIIYAMLALILVLAFFLLLWVRRRRPFKAGIDRSEEGPRDCLRLDNEGFQGGHSINRKSS